MHHPLIPLLPAVERWEFLKIFDRVNSFLHWRQYWNVFEYPEHLVGWLLTNMHCAYCGTNLMDREIPNRTACTDHLLPRSQSQYKHLECHSIMNAVACCRSCNQIKNGWDPNDGSFIGGDLTYDARLLFVLRTREYLDARRSKAQSKADSVMRDAAYALSMMRDLLQ